MRKKRILKFVIPILLTTFLVGMGYNNLRKASKIEDVSFNCFQEMVKNKKIQEVKIDFKDSKFYFKDFNNLLYKTDNPKDKDFKKDLLIKDVKVTETTTNGFLTILNSIFNLTFYGLLITLLFNSLKKMPLKTEKIDEVSKIPNKKLSDIAGSTEIKDDLNIIIDFLKNPQKYSSKGAKLPKGVILYGPPGTGKTLTAKAIAGEAGVPFFSASGSDFMQVYVGIGASRIRDLFKKARENSPCIVFIDEIDAIATRRGISNSDEKDQTLNALLTEMDGFKSNDGVLVMAATNRLDKLDEAILRGGRFDKHIMVGLPEQTERLEIIKQYVSNKSISDTIDLEELSKQFIGFSGADIENLFNEATIISITKGKDIIDNEDIDDAFFKIVMQGHKKERKKNDIETKNEIQLVAWHESGHALASKLLTKNDVNKVTIIPSSSGAGGVTFLTPKKMGLYSKKELLGEIMTLYAGRVAEFLLLGNEDLVTTGASNDIKKATELIDKVITTYGMSSDYGLLNLSSLQVDNNIIINEASKLSKELYEKTKIMLTNNLDILNDIASELIKRESLSNKELDIIINNRLDVRY